jgi:hypothetical protein
MQFGADKPEVNECYLGRLLGWSVAPFRALRHGIRRTWGVVFELWNTGHLLFQFCSLPFYFRPFIAGNAALLGREDPCRAGCSKSYLVSR